MKNILLTTTALATLFASVASAHTHKEKTMMDNDGLSVSVGGMLDVEAATRSQKNSYTSANSTGVYKQGITPGNKNIGFNTNADAYLKIQNKTAEGTKYGAQVGVATTTATLTQNGETSLARTFLFVDNDEMGRFEAGSNDGVATTMRTGADSIARATGGIDGFWGNYVVLNTFQPTTYTSTAVVSTNFITAPVSALTLANYANSARTVGGNELARKITYYTPQYNGFQAGLSYTPDLGNNGNTLITSAAPTAVTTPVAKNAVAGGLSWTGKFKHEQALKLSVVGETSSTTVSPADKGLGKKYYNNKSVIVGAEYTYEDFSAAASYGNQGKSGFTKNSTTQATSGSVGVKGGSFWTLGAAYVQGPVGASLTYMNSKLNTNKFDLVSLGLDYQVAPGLLPYVEVTYFTMKQKINYIAPVSGSNSWTNTASAYKNKGTAFILGTKLSF